MWQITTEKIKWLQQLCNTYAPSSQEHLVQRLVANSFAQSTCNVHGDAIGNCIISTNNQLPKQIALIAHADEIGLQITEINSDGLLRFRKIGGLRATSLIGHRVVVLTKTEHIEGVIGCDPMQDNGTEAGILVQTKDLWIDIGAISKEDAMQRVQVGNFVTFKEDSIQLSSMRYASKALDDRIGLFVISEVLDILASQLLSYGILGISTVQEEITHAGAKALQQQFTMAIVIDVDFATDIPTQHTEMGKLLLGGGVGVNMNADSNPILQELLITLAQKCNIPIQKTLSRNISGGTDASIILQQRNVPTLNINIPLRYMHSHYEICDLRDIEYCINLLVELIKYIDNNPQISFIPWQ